MLPVLCFNTVFRIWARYLRTSLLALNVKDRTQFECKCSRLFVLIRLSSLRINRRYEPAKRVFELLNRRRQRFLLLPIIHDLPLDILEVAHLLVVKAKKPHFSGRSHDEESRNYRYKDEYSCSKADGFRAPGIRIPIPAQVGKEVQKCYACDEEDNEHFQGESCCKIAAKKTIHKRDKVSDDRKAREEYRKDQRPSPDPQFAFHSIARDVLPYVAHQEYGDRHENDEGRHRKAHTARIRLDVIVRQLVRIRVINVLKEKRDKRDNAAIKSYHRARPEEEILRGYFRFIHIRSS